MFREAKPTRTEKVIGSIPIGGSTHNTSSPGMRGSVPMWLGSGVDPEGLEYRLLPSTSTAELQPTPKRTNQQLWARIAALKCSYLVVA
jgi:hypothetical protein